MLQRLPNSQPEAVTKPAMLKTRIGTLDFVRGLAILCILLMNITGFGLPKAAYLNPAYNGLPDGADTLTWGLLHVFVQGKFLAMFALLFGAGLQLLLPKGKHWLRARLSWLVLFGLIHAIFFWDGDILMAYGLIGLISWRMIRDASSTLQLLRAGLVLYVIGLGLLLLLGLIAGPEPSVFWLPGYAAIQYEGIWKIHGGWEAWRNRSDLLSANLMALAVQYGWQLAGLMLTGAALMRSGWLSGSFSQRHYRRTALWSLVVGLGIQVPTTLAQWQNGWEYHVSGYLLQVPAELTAPLMMIGYVSLIYAFWPQISRLKLAFALRQVGRMALTNYLLQTLLCTTLFYQFAMFNHWSRTALLWVVPVVWLINVLFSILWLRHFKQGPVEWLWRKLTALGTQTRS
ncbi:DUF418 family protein [Hafnia alvei]|uniref:DUF418 domain-containing protein YeiB n=1 Tax=Hafnia alvei TaxID=569 RepID=UPI00103302A1|nr:DUF418 domain-containing protein YeiB [Hafnia alvei]MDU3154864.1 DUF418 domain-containing protein YeiB [Hafnia alvei]TBL46613.1 DUF418 family protein [Hafnia alvei]